MEFWVDGYEYSGCYFNGKKNGLGTLLWDTGTKYEGEFLDNKMHGIVNLIKCRVYSP